MDSNKVEEHKQNENGVRQTGQQNRAVKTTHRRWGPHFWPRFPDTKRGHLRCVTFRRVTFSAGFTDTLR